jgi:hypothetical protein
VPTTERRPGNLAYWLVVVAAFTAAWSGVNVGSVKLVDVVLAVAAVTAVSALASIPLHPPWWVNVGAIAIGTILVVHVIAPTSYRYLNSRLRPNGTVLTQGEAPYVVGLEWLVALLVLPWLVVSVVNRTGRPVHPIAWAWMAGAALSAGVALSDFFGLSQIGPELTGLSHLSDRETGLATHPNNLGFSCVMTLPVAIHLASKRHLLGVGCLALLVCGILVSGSRGSQLGLVLALVLTAVVVPSRARLTPLMVYITCWVGVITVWQWGTVNAQFGEMLRFANTGDTFRSNSLRSLLARQALADFDYNPMIGIGYEVLVDAHSIYLQILAAGGLLLASGIMLFWFGLVRAGWRLRHVDPIAMFLVASVVVWLAVGLVENQLTDRYIYFPVAAIAAMTVRHQGKLDAAAADSRVGNRHDLRSPPR